MRWVKLSMSIVEYSTVAALKRFGFLEWIIGHPQIETERPASPACCAPGSIQLKGSDNGICCESTGLLVASV
jgi:hypothetical protein